MSATESVQHVVQEARRRGLITTEQLARHLRKATSSVYNLLNPYNERDKLSLEDTLDILDFVLARARAAGVTDLEWVLDPLQRVAVRFGHRMETIAIPDGDISVSGAQLILQANSRVNAFLQAWASGTPYQDLKTKLLEATGPLESLFIMAREDPAGGRARAALGDEI